MTIIDGRNLLFEYFSVNEYITKADFSNIDVLEEEKDISYAILLVALKDFEDSGLVRKISLNEEDAWVLEKPIEKYKQPIELNYDTILALHNLINDFCDEVGDSASKVDLLNITEKDIQTLIVIAHANLEHLNEDAQ